MNVLVIGASRGIGLETVKHALARGHQVTALARHPERMSLSHASLRTVRGDVVGPSALEDALRGQDAVINSIGIAPTFKPVTVFSEGVRRIIDAMRARKLQRFLFVTGIGAGESRGHGGFFYDQLVRRVVLKTIYDDKDRAEALLRESALDWLIVRPGFLTNGPMRGEYRALVDLTGVTAGKISRADVAHFLVSELETPTRRREAVLLTY